MRGILAAACAAGYGWLLYAIFSEFVGPACVRVWTLPLLALNLGDIVIVAATFLLGLQALAGLVMVPAFVMSAGVER